MKKLHELSSKIKIIWFFTGLVGFIIINIIFADFNETLNATGYTIIDFEFTWNTESMDVLLVAMEDSPVNKMIGYEDENGVIYYEIRDNRLYVHAINALEKGKGQGTKLMTFLDDLAYELGIDEIIYLNLSTESKPNIVESSGLSKNNIFIS